MKKGSEKGHLDRFTYFLRQKILKRHAFSLAVILLLSILLSSLAFAQFWYSFDYGQRNKVVFLSSDDVANLTKCITIPYNSNMTSPSFSDVFWTIKNCTSSNQSEMPTRWYLQSKNNGINATYCLNLNMNLSSMNVSGITNNTFLYYYNSTLNNSNLSCAGCMNFSTISYFPNNFTDNTFEVTNSLSSFRDIASVQFSINTTQIDSKNITICYYASRQKTSGYANVSINKSMTNIEIPLPVASPPAGWVCVNVSKTSLGAVGNSTIRVGMGCSVCAGSNNLYIRSDTTSPDGNSFLYQYATDKWTRITAEDYGIAIMYNKINYAPNVTTLLYNATSYCYENWTAQYTSCNISDQRVKYYIDLNGCGTFETLPADNGTIESCDYCSPSWYCGSYNTTCEDYWAGCLYANDSNYASCCAVTGLPSDCNFTGNLSSYKTPCGEIESTLYVIQYPYVDCNMTYPMNVTLEINGTIQQLDNLFIDFPNENQTLNFTWSNASQQYEITLIFDAEGDYPFSIWNDYPLGAMDNITGEFMVRCPFTTCFEVYHLDPKNSSNPYENIHAYMTAEFESEQAKQRLRGKSPYDKTLEQYIRPLGFKDLFNLEVFHAPYVSGQACIKMWERQKTYAIRLLDGEMTFPDGQYSTINITRLYGTNIFLGTLYLNGTNQTYKYYLTEQEFKPYTTIYNWLFFIGLLIILGITFALAIYVHPQIAFYFGIVLSFILITLRIIMWIFIG